MQFVACAIVLLFVGSVLALFEKAMRTKCPHCRQPLPGRAVVCAACGRDLVV